MPIALPRHASTTANTRTASRARSTASRTATRRRSTTPVGQTAASTTAPTRRAAVTPSRTSPRRLAPHVQLPGAGQQEREEARDDASAGTACHCPSVRVPRDRGRYPPGVSSRAWTAALAALVGLRVAIPLVALAASGHDLPGAAAVRLRAVERRRDRVLRRGSRADLSCVRAGRRWSRARPRCRRVGGVAAPPALDGDRGRRSRASRSQRACWCSRPNRRAPPSSAGRCSGRFRCSRCASSACSTPTSRSPSASRSRWQPTRSPSSRSRMPAAARAAVAPSASPRRRSSPSGRC